MRLNIPILEQIPQSSSVLIAGAGGGYDVFSGLPLFFELEERGYDVHLANFSFSDVVGLYEGEQLSDTLVGVSIDVENIDDYFPEYYLSEWFFNERNEFVTIWCFQKTGVRPLVKNYKLLVEHLGINCIILVDGGVDSLMHGDEQDPGTLLEDMLSISTVSELNNVPLRFLTCLGLGVEYEVGYAHLFENIANLAKSNAFLGTCSLITQMPVFQKYKEAVFYTFNRQPDYKSVICSSVISAVHGEYGDFHLIKRTQERELHISPLMSMYWFFDLSGVANSNRLVKPLTFTHTVDDAWQKMQNARQSFDERPLASNPLP